MSTEKNENKKILNSNSEEDIKIKNNYNLENISFLNSKERLNR